MMLKNSRLGLVNCDFEIFKLKDALLKNDSGEWGSEPQNDSIGVIRSTNFSNVGKLDLTDVALRHLTPQKRLEKTLNEGDILIERSGGSDSQPVGRVGLITKRIAEKGFAFANFIQRISTNNLIEPSFLYYCLQQMYEMGLTASMQYQTTGIRNLDWKLYIKSILPKPPKNEQNCIAGILAKVDEAIEAVENSIKAAERLKRSLMQNLLSGKLKPDGSFRKKNEFEAGFLNTAPMKGLQKFLYFQLPSGWTIDPIKKIMDLKYGIALPEKIRSGSVFPVYGSNGIVGFHDVPHVNKPGIIVGRKGTAGAITWSDKPFIPIDTTYYVETYEGTNEKWLYYALQTLNLDKLNSATGVPGLNRRDALSLFIMIPPLDEQKKIINAIEDFESCEVAHKKKLQVLKDLKKSLMQNLLTGKVRVDVEKINKLLEDQ